eukprot:1557222-Lingulodinium_polyedra.AAC.1
MTRTVKTASLRSKGRGARLPPTGTHRVQGVPRWTYQNLPARSCLSTRRCAAGRVRSACRPYLTSSGDAVRSPA